MNEEVTQKSNTHEDTKTSDMPPADRCVVFYNDDYTTQDFVINMLHNVFLKDTDESTKLMQKAQENGHALIGVYAYDVALTRQQLVLAYAKSSGFPFKIEVM